MSGDQPDDIVLAVRDVLWLVGAGPGRVYGWIDDDRRLIDIDPEGETTAIIGGVGDPTCGPSTNALSTAVDDVERVAEDGAGNVWIDIGDGDAPWVVRVSEGSVVQPGPIENGR